MDQYYVIGHPIAHSKSPQIHARFAELTGQTLHYERLLVEPGHFGATLAKLLARGDVRGCNVTVPFKLEAFEQAHEASPRAQLALAANTLQFEGGRICADNTDGLGLVRDIEVNAGQPLQGRDVLLLGGGGAAAGALGPLLLAGPRRLVLTNRTLAKAQAIAQRHREHPSLAEALARTELVVLPLGAELPASDVVINASASSLSGEDMPLVPAALQPDALVYDMMYGPAAEPFLRWAADCGARCRDGLGMLVEQAAEAFLLWRGVRPPAATVLHEMRQAP